MKRSRYTEEQIIAVLREHEAGAKTADLCRTYGMSEATLYNWKAKFGGMDVSDAKRLRALEGENAALVRFTLVDMFTTKGTLDAMGGEVHPFHYVFDNRDQEFALVVAHHPYVVRAV